MKLRLGYDIDKLEKSEKLSKEYKTNFIDFLSKADSQGIIEKELLIERLEENHLSEANLIEKTAFQRKKARVNTKNQ